MTVHAGSIAPAAEVLVLAEALGVASGEVEAQSREPLGAGSVAGFAVADDQYFVDTSGVPVPGSEDADARTPRIWIHPADPHLPALAAAAVGDAAHVLLGRLDIVATGLGEFFGYRPGRRAVLRIPTTEGHVWVKVVRPSRVARIVESHSVAERAGLPVPRIHGWSDQGLIIMADAAGTPAADVSWRPDALLDEVEALRERITGVAWHHRGRSVADRLDWYEGRAAPDTARLIRTARDLIDDAPRIREPVVVHGDLHYGQLFLTDGAISGLIDVDTLGIADPAEDEAAFLSHAIASAVLTAGPEQARVWHLADGAAHRWAGDPRTRGLSLVHLIGHMIAAHEREEPDFAAALDRAASTLAAGRAPSAGRGKSALIPSFDTP